MDVSKVKAPPVAPQQTPKHTEPVKQPTAHTEQNKTTAVKTEAPQPSPVVNAQGHKTGRLLNAVA